MQVLALKAVHTLVGTDKKVHLLLLSFCFESDRRDLKVIFCQVNIYEFEVDEIDENQNEKYVPKNIY